MRRERKARLKARLPALALLAGGALLGAACVGLLPGPGSGWRLAKAGFTVEQYALGRAQVIQAQLDVTPPGAIILAGDSHAELTPPLAQLCGRPVRNAGVSGATVGRCADMWRGLTMARARALIVTIGTNNLLRKHHNSPARFEADVRRLLAELSGRAEALLVSAIPPAGASMGRYMALEQNGAFTAVIGKACAALANCQLVDLYADERSRAVFGMAQGGTMADGMHLRHYDKRYRDAGLCRAIDDAVSAA